MSERSERIINTGFGEALCAEPFAGATSGDMTRVVRSTGDRHQ
jgi:hypothetical protein